MTRLTQMLLLVCYGVLALALAILLPRLSGVSQSMAALFGFIVFMTAWQINSWIVSMRRSFEEQNRLDRMEDALVLLRSEMERTRRDVRRRVSEAGLPKHEELVSELQILHTLIDQVVRKQKENEINGHSVAVPVSAINDGKVGNNPAGVQTEELYLDESVSGSAPGAAQDIMSLSEQDVSSDALNVTDNSEADKDQMLTIIRNSLTENRVDLYLQPTVRLPARQTIHFECFSRVRDEAGGIMVPHQYMDVAESLGLAGTLDNLLLFRLIQLLRRIGGRRPDTKFFCNLSLYSLQDDEFFPQFVDYMGSNSEFGSRLIFEIAQTDYEKLDTGVVEKLTALGNRGFGFCLDSAKDIDSLDLSQLEKHKFKYIKVDWALLKKSFSQDELSILSKSTRNRGIQLIAARVETQDETLSVIDAGLELAQGYAFGMPGAAQDFSNEL